VAQRISAAALSRGLIVRPLVTGDILQVSPPLVVTPGDVEEIARRLDGAVAEVAAELADAPAAAVTTEARA
jgi:adenosylmethionine-8-amino-7-oxononanoate aminotransferase